MLLFVNVLKQITGSIQQSPLNQNDFEFLKLIPVINWQILFHIPR